MDIGITNRRSFLSSPFFKPRCEFLNYRQTCQTLDSTRRQRVGLLILSFICLLYLNRRPGGIHVPSFVCDLVVILSNTCHIKPKEPFTDITMDLIARHYSVRTANTYMHSTSPMRFTDGEGHAWLFLELKDDHTLSTDDTSEYLGTLNPSEAEQCVSLISQHITSPKWSINLDAPEATLQSVLASPALSSLLAQGKASVENIESMIFNPTTILPAVPDSAGWEIQDGKTWFAQKYSTLADLIKYEDVWVIQRNEEIGGYIVALPDVKTGRVYISDLLVFPEYRRRGLGRALLQHVISGAKESQWRVYLTVFSSNTGAKGMYLSEGFTVEKKFVVIAST